MVRQITAAMAAGRTLHGATIETPRDFFAAIDADGTGTVPKHELRAALEKLDVRLTEAQLSTLFSEADTAGDGVLSYGKCQGC